MITKYLNLIIKIIVIGFGLPGFLTVSANAATPSDAYQKAEQQRAQAEENQQQTMQSFANEFEQSVGSIVEELSKSAANQRSSTEVMNDSIGNVSTHSASVGSTSAESFENMQSIATAVEELSVSAQEVGRQVQNSATKTANASEITQNTAKEVSTLAETTESIQLFLKAIGKSRTEFRRLLMCHKRCQNPLEK